MKIRNPKTGEEFLKPSEAYDAFCKNHKDGCDSCPLNGYSGMCNYPMMDDPEATIEQMGYEIVHDKPMVCDLLGVDLYQGFKYAHKNYRIVPVYDGHKLLGGGIATVCVGYHLETRESNDKDWYSVFSGEIATLIEMLDNAIFIEVNSDETEDL